MEWRARRLDMSGCFRAPGWGRSAKRIVEAGRRGDRRYAGRRRLYGRLIGCGARRRRAGKRVLQGRGHGRLLPGSWRGRFRFLREWVVTGRSGCGRRLGQLFSFHRPVGFAARLELISGLAGCGFAKVILGRGQAHCSRRRTAGEAIVEGGGIAHCLLDPEAGVFHSPSALTVLPASSPGGQVKPGYWTRPPGFLPSTTEAG